MVSYKDGVYYCKVKDTKPAPPKYDVQNGDPLIVIDGGGALYFYDKEDADWCEWGASDGGSANDNGGE